MLTYVINLGTFNYGNLMADNFLTGNILGGYHTYGHGRLPKNVVELNSKRVAVLSGKQGIAITNYGRIRHTSEVERYDACSN